MCQIQIGSLSNSLKRMGEGRGLPAHNVLLTCSNALGIQRRERSSSERTFRSGEEDASWKCVVQPARIAQERKPDPPSKASNSRVFALREQAEKITAALPCTVL